MSASSATEGPAVAEEERVMSSAVAASAAPARSGTGARHRSSNASSRDAADRSSPHPFSSGFSPAFFASGWTTPRSPRDARALASRSSTHNESVPDSVIQRVKAAQALLEASVSSSLASQRQAGASASGRIVSRQHYYNLGDSDASICASSAANEDAQKANGGAEVDGNEGSARPGSNVQTSWSSGGAATSRRGRTPTSPSLPQRVSSLAFDGGSSLTAPPLAVVSPRSAVSLRELCAPLPSHGTQQRLPRQFAGQALLLLRRQHSERTASEYFHRLWRHAAVAVAVRACTCSRGRTAQTSLSPLLSSSEPALTPVGVSPVSSPLGVAPRGLRERARAVRNGDADAEPEAGGYRDVFVLTAALPSFQRYTESNSAGQCSSHAPANEDSTAATESAPFLSAPVSCHSSLRRSSQSPPFPVTSSTLMSAGADSLAVGPLPTSPHAAGGGANVFKVTPVFAPQHAQRSPPLAGGGGGAAGGLDGDRQSRRCSWAFAGTGVAPARTPSPVSSASNTNSAVASGRDAIRAAHQDAAQMRDSTTSGVSSTHAAEAAQRERPSRQLDPTQLGDKSLVDQVLQRRSRTHSPVILHPRSLSESSSAYLLRLRRCSSKMDSETMEGGWDQQYFDITTREVSHRLLLRRRECLRRKWLTGLLEETTSMLMMASLRPEWRSRALQEVRTRFDEPAPGYETLSSSSSSSSSASATTTPPTTTAASTTSSSRSRGLLGSGSDDDADFAMESLTGDSVYSERALRNTARVDEIDKDLPPPPHLPQLSQARSSSSNGSSGNDREPDAGGDDGLPREGGGPPRHARTRAHHRDGPLTGAPAECGAPCAAPSNSSPSVATASVLTRTTVGSAAESDVFHRGLSSVRTLPYAAELPGSAGSQGRNPYEGSSHGNSSHSAVVAVPLTRAALSAMGVDRSIAGGRPR